MGYAILNKPGGLPGHGCRSNNTENVCVLFHEALKLLWSDVHRKIHVTLPQHVDAEVEGLIIVSTRKVFANYCAKHQNVDEATGADEDEAPAEEKLAAGEETNRCRCLVCVKDPADMDHIQHLAESRKVLTHCFDPKSPNPKKKFVRSQPKSADHDWTESKMRIISVGCGTDERALRAASVTSQCADANDPDVTLAHRLWKPEPGVNPADRLGAQHVMELEVEDLSDLPHQLRGQLAQLGCPIVGDSSAVAASAKLVPMATPGGAWRFSAACYPSPIPSGRKVESRAMEGPWSRPTRNAHSALLMRGGRRTCKSTATVFRGEAKDSMHTSIYNNNDESKTERRAKEAM